MSATVEQIVQIIGSLFILAPFVLVQRRTWTTTSRVYVLANLIGSSILAIDAAYGQQWGFLLLEGVWALVSGAGLLTSLRGRPAAG
ncbi:MAG: CBU_0592 family membrane protein [Jatrophihabitans sp.]